MKINVLICSKDKDYVGHLVNYLSVHYSDKLNLSIFSDISQLTEYIELYSGDVLLLDDDDTFVSKQTISTAYLSDASEWKGEKARIFKYQKGEVIYKRILDIYASKTDSRYFARVGEQEKQALVHVFMPLNGGAGSSTVARAYAVKKSISKKILYLDLELIGNCDCVFKAEGEFCFDEILYALKSRRGNLRLKLESALKKSNEGPMFYSPSENPMSLLELKEDEFAQMLGEMKKSGLFDEIVLDMDGIFSAWTPMALKEADEIWLVTDSSDAALEKYGQFMKFADALEKKREIRFQAKMKLFYNRYSNRVGREIPDCKLDIAGGSPRYESMSEIEIIRRMARSDVFEKNCR